MKSFIVNLKEKKAVIIVCFLLLSILYAVIVRVFFKSRVEALIEHSRFYLASSNPEKALELLNSAVNLKSSEAAKSRIYILRGITYSYLMEYEKAQDDFFHALKFKGADKPFIYCRLAIIYNKTDKPDEFIIYFSMFKKEVPDLIVPMFPDYESINDLYFMTADYYVSEGEYEKAAAVYSNMMLMNPQKESFYHNRGDCYFKSGQIDKARTDISMWVELTPPEERNLKQVLTGNIILGRYEEALKDLERFRKNDADSALGLFFRGQIRFLQGKNILALEYLTNFLKNPGDEHIEAKEAMKMIRKIQNKLP